MKREINGLFAILLLGGMLAIIPAAHSQLIIPIGACSPNIAPYGAPPTANVHFQWGTNGTPGSTFTVQIWAYNISVSDPMIGYQIGFFFNPTVLQVEAVTNGSVLNHYSRDYLSVSGTINNTGGYVCYYDWAIVTPYNISAANAWVDLAHVTFEVNPSLTAAQVVSIAGTPQEMIAFTTNKAFPGEELIFLDTSLNDITPYGHITNGTVTFTLPPSETTTPSLTVTGVNETDGLSLTVQVEQAVYRQGEPVTIWFTLTNISNQTINFPTAAWTFDFQILNDTNHLLFQYSTSQVFPLVIMNLPLSPGESYITYQVWPQMCNVSLVTGAGVAVSPGAFDIVGLLWNPSQVIVRTPPLQITVVPAFVVAISPSSVALDVGQSVAFTSSVTGETAPYSYQWQLNGANATGATYSLWTFTTQSVGSYNVSLVVTDALGGVETSNTASVTVDPAMSVSISPYSVTMCVGQSQTFIADVAGGTSPYSYLWGWGGSVTSALENLSGPTTSNTRVVTFNSTGNFVVVCVVVDSSMGTPAKGPWIAASVTVNATMTADPMHISSLLRHLRMEASSGNFRPWNSRLAIPV
ncbi:MAG TPA: BsuPI-related putative proteinase inhibitor [Candidatus Bathyarchaeia archaeon]|nr:BsuPI-related putative proteinase inhibitor [Candidatus Bathyarchaeia archaeon]